MKITLPLVFFLLTILITPTSWTKAQDSTGTIQGLKLGPFAQQFNDPGATITLGTQSIGTSVNPYFFTNLPAGTHTITSTTPAGYTVFNSPCINCTNHPASLFNIGTEATVTVPAGGYVDLTWIYLPVPSPQPPIQSPPPAGVATKLFGGSLPTEVSGSGKGNVYTPFVMVENGIHKMWYGGQGYDGHDRIHYAESSDGLNWIKRGVVLDRGNSNHVNDPSVVKVGSTYYMYYTEAVVTELDEIHLATSTDGLNWAKQGAMLTGTTSWDKYLGRPAVIYEDTTFKMWYDGRVSSTPGSESFVGYATSTDGFNWVRSTSNPVFADDVYDTGQGISQVGAINVRKIGNRYIMVYQAKGTKWASSTDGITWKKWGLLAGLSGTDFDTLYHATPKIFINDQNIPIAIYMAGVSVPEWNQNSIGIVKLKGDEFVQILSGDLNNDNKVDIFDYNLIVADFGKSGTPGFTPADITKDGKIDIFDYNILVGNFSKSNV